MKCYTSITELPLSSFISCYVDNNLYALVIEGEADVKELSDIWSNILQEYSEALGDEEQKMYALLMKEITLLTIDYSIVNELAPVLQLIYHKRFADELNEVLKTNFKFDWDDQEQYQKDLQRCINRSKSIKIQLNLKQAEFESIEKRIKEKNGGNDSKPTRQYFLSILISLSNYAKFHITPETITTFEFCERVKQLNQYLSTAKETAT